MLARALILAAALGAGACNLMQMEDPPAEGVPGLGSNDLGADAPRTIATGLEVPWEIRFLPNGDLLVTERPGRLVRLSPEGERIRSNEVSGVSAAGESGLMGLALDPMFAQNGRIYVCYTTEAGSELTNRVDRFRYTNDGLSERTTILEGMEGARFHDGCRLEFGPDGFLYVSMGDAGNGENAQEDSSLNGKILRITTDGEPAPGNPFGNEVFSLGHRNPQGLAFDDSGRLWITEHGPSGFSSGMDEVNLVIRGNNYGWPVVRGEETAPGMVGPVIQSGDATWAPAGAAWVSPSLFFGGLRGASLYEVYIPPDALSPTAPTPLALEVQAHFAGEFGRIRAVRVGPDGLLYFSTSNRDGRGEPREGDDRILVVDPAALAADPIITEERPPPTAGTLAPDY